MFFNESRYNFPGIRICLLMYMYIIAYAWRRSRYNFPGIIFSVQLSRYTYMSAYVHNSLRLAAFSVQLSSHYILGTTFLALYSRYNFPGILICLKYTIRSIYETECRGRQPRLKAPSGGRLVGGKTPKCDQNLQNLQKILHTKS